MCGVKQMEDVCEYRGSLYTLRHVVSFRFLSGEGTDRVWEETTRWNSVTTMCTPLDFNIVNRGFRRSLAGAGGRGCLGHFLFEGDRLYLRAILMDDRIEGKLPTSSQWLARHDSFRWDWGLGSSYLAPESLRERAAEFTLKEPHEVKFGTIGLTEERFQDEPDFQFSTGRELFEQRTPSKGQLLELIRAA